MKKDYHKGVKLQIWIPEDLNDEVNTFISKVNNIGAEKQISKTYVVNQSLKLFLKLACEKYGITTNSDYIE